MGSDSGLTRGRGPGEPPLSNRAAGAAPGQPSRVSGSVAAPHKKRWVDGSGEERTQGGAKAEVLNPALIVHLPPQNQSDPLA